MLRPELLRFLLTFAFALDFIFVFKYVCINFLHNTFKNYNYLSFLSQSIVCFNNKMSLLDQLSSLCAPQTGQNQYSTFFSYEQYGFLETKVESLQNPKMQQLQQKNYTEPINQSQSSQSKMIQLFDDVELGKNCRFAKNVNRSSHTKKKNPNPGQQKNALSYFNVGIDLQNENTMIKLTKMSYLVKNKVRKTNYEFFVKLQQYIKCLQKGYQISKKLLQDQKIQKIQKGLQKLSQTLSIIHLKYFQSHTQKVTLDQGIQKQQKYLSTFEAIKMVSKKVSSFTTLCKCLRNIVNRTFWSKLQQINKRNIKIDLLSSILAELFTNKMRLQAGIFFKQLSLHRFSARPQPQIIFQRISKDKKKQQITQSLPSQFELRVHNEIRYFVDFNLNAPLNLRALKALNSYFMQFPNKQFQFATHESQNIPLKLHNLKNHEQQTNLNDCIDNGHLMMNQMKKNLNFKEELQNLTISKINSNSNYSLNSSALTYENLVMPQLMNNEVFPKNFTIQQRLITMRKSHKPQDNIVKQVKKPRTSLVITKRKQSINDINSVFGSQKSQILNKNKSSAVSRTKISGDKKSISDKQVIRKMLDQLNKKFQGHNKTIQIKISDKKVAQNRKQTIASTSGNKVQRKKCKSQSTQPALFFQKQNSNSKIKKQKTQNNQENYKISLISSSKYQKIGESYKGKKCTSGKNSENCFMSVTLNQSSNSKYNNRGGPKPSKKGLTDNMSLKRLQDNITPIIRHNDQYLSQNFKGLPQVKDIPLKGESYFKIDLTKDKKASYQTEIKRQLLEFLPQFPDKKQTSYNQTSGLLQGRSNVNICLNKNPHQEQFQNHQDQFQNFKEQNVIQTLLMQEKSQKNINFVQHEAVDDSFLIKNNQNLHISSDEDSALEQYISLIPSNVFITQNKEEMQNTENYRSQKSFSYGINMSKAQKNSEYDKQCFYTGTKAKINNIKDRIRESLEKKKKSFEKSRDEWDMMFEKQKSKFLKKQQNQRYAKTQENKVFTTRKPSLNEQLINEIKKKIDQSIILAQKDTNSASKTTGKTNDEMFLQFYRKSNLATGNNSKVKLRQSKNFESNFISLTKSHVFKIGK